MATHWGWYWRVKKKHISRTLCSKLNSIDSFRKDIMQGFSVEPLKVMAMVATQGLEITYRNRSNISYVIEVEKLLCNYGGFRYFFKCPLCKKRMRFLYFAENSIFLCRKCLNLSYKSQKLRPSDRYYHMSNKVKDFVKQRGGLPEIHKKPPRIHTKTFKMLCAKQSYYQNKLHQATNQELRLWHGDKIALDLDDFFDYVDESKPWKKKKFIQS